MLGFSLLLVVVDLGNERPFACPLVDEGRIALFPSETKGGVKAKIVSFSSEMQIVTRTVVRSRRWAHMLRRRQSDGCEARRGSDAPSNGEALCLDCHKKTRTYGG